MSGSWIYLIDFFCYRIDVLVMTINVRVTAYGFRHAFYCILVLLLLLLLLHTHTQYCQRYAHSAVPRTSRAPGGHGAVAWTQ